VAGAACGVDAQILRLAGEQQRVGEGVEGHDGVGPILERLVEPGREAGPLHAALGRRRGAPAGGVVGVEVRRRRRGIGRVVGRREEGRRAP
jgi:hypothetical protein